MTSLDKAPQSQTAKSLQEDEDVLVMDVVVLAAKQWECT